MTQTKDLMRYMAILSKGEVTVDVGCGVTKEVALHQLIEKAGIKIERTKQDMLVAGKRLLSNGSSIEITEIT